MVRMGLIGAGTMGEWYAAALTEYEVSDLVAVCDLDEQRAAALTRQWGGVVYDDFRAMLAKEQLDAVAVATPDKRHREPAIACLEAGKHVLCEKPLATTLEDGEAMRAAVERSGKELMVNFGNRHRPRAKALRSSLIEEREVGEIGTVYIELNERLSKTDSLSWAEETSPVWFLLSHCIDYVRYVTGLEIVEVFGYETRKILAKRGLDTSDTCIFVGQLSNGGHIFLGSTWAYPDEYVYDIDFAMRVIGEQGLLECQMHPHDLLLHRDKGRAVNYVYSYADHRGQTDNWWVQSTRYFVHCIEKGLHPTPDVHDGIACLKVLLAMDESIRTGRPVGTGQ